MTDSCSPRKLEPGFAQTYSNPSDLMTSTMKSEPLLSVVKVSTSGGAVPSAVIVMTGVAPRGAAACCAGDSALAIPLDVASAAAPAKAPRFRNCRRARSRDFLDLAILETYVRSVRLQADRASPAK